MDFPSRNTSPRWATWEAMNQSPCTRVVKGCRSEKKELGMLTDHTPSPSSFQPRTGSAPVITAPRGTALR